MRSTTLAAPLLLALQRELLEREAWPLLRATLPGQDEALLGGRARRATSTASRPPSWPRREATDASLRDPGAGEHDARWPASTRRAMARAARARAPVREARAARGAGAATLWPTPAARPAGRAWARRVRGLRARARCSSTATTRPRPGASCATCQARLIERLAPARASCASRPRAPTCTLRVDGPHVGQLRRQAQHALGRGLHRPARGLAPRAASASRSRRARAASRSRAIELEFREGRVVERARRARRGLPAARRSTPTTARRRLGEIGIGTNFGIDRADRRDPVRREDRRHRPPRGRPLLPGDRRHERVRRALGHDLRPARAAGTLTADGEVVQRDGVFA